MRWSFWQRGLGVVATVVALCLLGLPGSASGFDSASFPTQSLGDRGVDVRAIQQLLHAHGQDPPADGVFAESTVEAVRAFQTAQGLDVDGIVGPQTWGALATTLRQGDSGPAVRALQLQLNAKIDAGLTVSGGFDAATDAAVRDFQGHAGIGVDGIVGPVTWENLAWHFGYPDFEANNLCDQDPDGNGTAANWATGAAVAQLQAAARAFGSTGNGAVPYGDAGWEHGGPIDGHSSHQVGLDIDIWPIRTDDAQCSASRITWQSAEYDRDATRALVEKVRATAPGHVALIFFNDPVLIDEGLTSHWDNHDNHLHVRYCEAVHPSSLYTC